MTVEEIINELLNYPMDMKCVTSRELRDDKCALDDVTRITEVNKRGNYLIDDWKDDSDEVTEVTKVVVINLP